MYDRGDFAGALLEQRRCPNKRIHNRIAVVTWEVGEGGPSLDDSWNPKQARFNPLNVTKIDPINGRDDFNSARVQNYVSFARGVQLTAEVLDEDQEGYAAIRRHLKANDTAFRTLHAVVHSIWGTSPLVFQILDGVRTNYSAYARKPIGQ